MRERERRERERGTKRGREREQERERDKERERAPPRSAGMPGAPSRNCFASSACCRFLWSWFLVWILGFMSEVLVSGFRDAPPVLPVACLKSGIFSRDEEGYNERRRCSRDTYPGSDITNHTRIRKNAPTREEVGRAPLNPKLLTLHPTPSNLHPPPFTLHPSPFTFDP